MGFLLVQGTFSYLQDALPVAGADKLFALSKQLVAGSLSVEQIVNMETLLGVREQNVFGKALEQGFGRVFLYGGTGVSLLALISFLIFNPHTGKKMN
jgi:hypothetical protein